MDEFPATQVLESTQLLEATQILGGDDQDDESHIVGRLEVGASKHKLVFGDNRVGRDPKCEITIHNPSLSRTHAVIEAEAGCVTIHDVKSSNGTKKGGVRLKPNVRYNLESGDQLIFGDVIAVFIAGLEPETACDSDNDSNVSDSLFDVEDITDDENRPPNFVPDTPVNIIKQKPFTRPSLGDLSFVPESQSSPLPTSILKQQAQFKVPDSPATDLDDSSFLCPSQQPVQVRERPSRLIQGSFKPGADRTSTLLIAPTEQPETSNDDLKASVIPDSDDEEDMFAIGTQAVNETDDEEAFGPTQAANETKEESLPDETDVTAPDTVGTQAVDETAEYENTETSKQEVESKNPSDLREAGLFKRVDTDKLDVLFNKANTCIFNAETQATGPEILSADTQAPIIADTRVPDILNADTQATDVLTAETQVVGPDILSADTQAPVIADTPVPDILSADTRAPDVLLTAETQGPELDIGADTQVSELLSAETQAPEMFAADTGLPELLIDAPYSSTAVTSATDMLVADTQVPDLLNAETQAFDLKNADPIEACHISIRNKLSDSQIMVASTQDLVCQMNDSDFGVSSRGLRLKLSDSDIMCASTQVLVAKLNESDLLDTETQAMADSSINASLLLGAATQAVIVEDVPKSTEGLHVVDSMELLEDNSSGCDTSTDDLLFLSTQPVFKLPCMPMGKSKSSTSALLKAGQENEPSSKDSEANTDFHDESGSELKEAAIIDTQTELIDSVAAIAEADTVPIEPSSELKETTLLNTEPLTTTGEANTDSHDESGSEFKKAAIVDKQTELIDSVAAIAEADTVPLEPSSDLKETTLTTTKQADNEIGKVGSLNTDTGSKENESCADGDQVANTYQDTANCFPTTIIDSKAHPVDEDETQCFESFTDIKDNLEAGETVQNNPILPNILVSNETIETVDDETASNASDDLLAISDNLELHLDETPSDVDANISCDKVNIIEAVKASVNLTKVASINTTNFHSITMDQTSVVESDIVSANDDTDALSDGSENLLDEEDLIDTLDYPAVIVKESTPVPVAVVIPEDIDSPVFKKGKSVTPREAAIRNNCMANDSKDISLQLNASIEDSPIFRKKNASISSTTQNNSGLIKSLIDDGELSPEKEKSKELDEVDDKWSTNLDSKVIGNVVDKLNSIGEQQVLSIGTMKPKVDQVNADSKTDENHEYVSISEVNNSIIVRRRSNTPEDVLKSCKYLSPTNVTNEIIAEVVSPEKSSEADSGPLLPETQSLKGEDEEISDDEINSQEEELTSGVQVTYEGGDNLDAIKSIAEDMKQQLGHTSGDVVESPSFEKVVDCFQVGENVKTDAEHLQIQPVATSIDDGNSNELDATPVAPIVNKLGRGKRRGKARGKATLVNSMENEVEVSDIKSTDLQVDETQPWTQITGDTASVESNDEPTQPFNGGPEVLLPGQFDDEPTQPLDGDSEVLLPGQSGNDEVDSCAATQPLEETVYAEPDVKKSKGANDVPAVRKSSRRSQVTKAAIEIKAVVKNNKRNSAEDFKPIVKRGRHLKLASTSVVTPVQKEDDKKKEHKNEEENKLGKRIKKLKVPSSLLIASPAAEDMFVDDADSIPSPVTNGKPVVALKTKVTRKYRTKVEKSATVQDIPDDLEMIEEDEPVTKKRSIRGSRSRNSKTLHNTNVEPLPEDLEVINESEPIDIKRTARNNCGTEGINKTNMQSSKSKNSRASLQPGPSRKSLDDFSPKSKTKMEVSSVGATGAVKKGKQTVKKILSDDISVPAGETSITTGSSSTKTDASALVAPSRRGARGKKVDEAEKEEFEKPTKVLPEPTKRGSRKKADPVNSTVSVMEVIKKTEVTEVASKRGGRSRKTEPINIEPSVEEVPSGRRIRNTSGASKVENPTTNKAPELTKEGRTSKRARGRKDSETSNVSSTSSKSKKEVDEVSTTTSRSRGRKRLSEETPESSPSKKRLQDVSSTGSVRSRLNSSTDSNASPSLRKVEALSKNRHLVMFTGYNDQSDVTIVKELRGSTTESLTECTVLVTDQIRRTAKFLSMVAKGVPIVAPVWLSESKRAGKFLDPWDFILKDPPNEKKWGFKLEDTLKKARRARLLEGLSIHVTEKVKPSPVQCKDFIECGGGQFIESLPVKASPGLYVVSCSDDKKSTSNISKAGVPVMEKEWMLSGLLKYKLDKNLKLK